MAKSKSTRLLIQLDEYPHRLLKELSTMTGVSMSEIIVGCLMPKLGELQYMQDWLKTQQEGSDAYVRGVHSLQAQGPRNLISDIRMIDPQYRADWEPDADAATFINSKEVKNNR